jgi:hypothetical protein
MLIDRRRDKAEFRNMFSVTKHLSVVVNDDDGDIDNF